MQLRKLWKWTKKSTKYNLCFPFVWMSNILFIHAAKNIVEMGKKKVVRIIYVFFLCECQISFSLKYVSEWHRKTPRPKLHPFHFYFHFTWRKRMQISSFQLLFLTSIHVNSLFKFITNDQETSWGASDWTVSKWPLLYVMGFRFFFHRSIFIFFIPFSICIARFEMNLSTGIPVDNKTCYSTLSESIIAFITLW